MSCTVPPKLLTYYSNKVNIYDSSCFILLPNWRSCPPPPSIYIAPQIVYPPAGPYIPPTVCPFPQSLHFPGTYCSGVNAPCNTSYYNGSAPVGTEIPCNAVCGQSQSVISNTTGYSTTGYRISGCSSCQ